MAFQDLAAFVRPGFDLPVLGKSYYVPPPNGRDGLWLQALMDGAESFVLTQAVGAANKAILSDDKERTAYQIALGTAYAEMESDEVPWPVLKHCGMTAWLHWTRGEAAAEKYWERFQAGPGKAPTAETTSPQPATLPTDPSTQTPG